MGATRGELRLLGGGAQAQGNSQDQVANRDRDEGAVQGDGTAREQQDEAFATYRWMLEELRISLFAQELKTRFPISGKRMEKQWQKVAQRR